MPAEPVMIRTTTDGHDYEQLLFPGTSWRIGKNERCDLQVRNPGISAIAVVLRFDELSQTTPGAYMLVFVLQRGARVKITNELGERMELMRGAPGFALRPGTKYTIDISALGFAAEVKFRTPGPGPSSGGDTGNETLTWTISGPRTHYPAWVDVAALAVVIDIFPELRPSVEDRQLSASRSLRLAVELFLGFTSLSYTQRRLSDALEDAKIRVSSGQDKQARVAQHFAGQFPIEKLERLKSLLAEGIQALADAEH